MLALYSRLKWDKPMLSVCWSLTNDEYNNTTKERYWVMDAVRKSWEKYGGIKFDFLGTCSANYGCVMSFDISIGLFEGNPRVVTFGADLKGVPKGMLLNFYFLHWRRSCQFTRESCIRNIAVRVFGHALGIVHEQGSINDEHCNDTVETRTCLTELLDYENSSMSANNWTRDGILSLKDIDILRIVYRENFCSFELFQSIFILTVFPHQLSTLATMFRQTVDTPVLNKRLGELVIPTGCQTGLVGMQATVYINNLVTINLVTFTVSQIIIIECLNYMINNYRNYKLLFIPNTFLICLLL